VRALEGVLRAKGGEVGKLWYIDKVEEKDRLPRSRASAGYIPDIKENRRGGGFRRECITRRNQTTFFPTHSGDGKAWSNYTRSCKWCGKYEKK